MLNISHCKNPKKSTFSAWTNSDQTLDQQANLFYNDCQITGNSISFACGGSTGIKFNNLGIYLIIVTANGKMDDQAGDIVITLTKNDIPINGATASTNSGQNTIQQTLTFSDIITVDKCEDLRNIYRVLNAGIKTVYSLMSIKIVKII